MWKGSVTGLSQPIEHPHWQSKDHISFFENTKITRQLDAFAAKGTGTWHIHTLSPVDLAIVCALAQARNTLSTHEEIGQSQRTTL
jgi:hypothetical protein